MIYDIISYDTYDTVRTVSYRTVPYHMISYHTYDTVQQCGVVCHSVSRDIISYDTILYGIVQSDIRYYNVIVNIIQYDM